MFNVEEINFIWKTAIASECLLFQSKLWQTLAGLGHLIRVESWIIFVRKTGIFPSEKVRQQLKFFIVNEIRPTAQKIRSCIVLKDAIGKKLCCERTSPFYIYVCIQPGRRRPTDGLHLKFPFSRRNWLSRSSPFPVNRRRRRELRCGS